MELMPIGLSKILWVTVGLPRSGKSSWAQSMGGVPIVCPDAIRLALHGERFIARAEPFVWAIAQVMVMALFRAGHQEVIVDATNTTRARRAMWVKPTEWETRWKLFHDPAIVCRNRALQVFDTELAEVIDRMAKGYEPVAIEIEGGVLA